MFKRLITASRPPLSAKYMNKTPDYLRVPSVRWFKGHAWPTRDSMREKCYAAERPVREAHPGKLFANFSEVCAYIKSLMETDWFMRRWWSFTTVEVRERRNNCRSYAAASGRYMQFSPQDAHGDKVTEWTILHELAHCVTPSGHYHSRLWAKNFVELVHFRMGEAAGKALAASFRKHGMKLRPYPVPGTRKMPHNALAALEAYRERRAASARPDDEVFLMLGNAIGHAAENAPAHVKAQVEARVSGEWNRILRD